MQGKPEEEQFGDWQILQRLGAGGYGTVYKVQRILSDETAPRLGALKLMNEKKNRDIHAQAKTEINALSQVESAYIAELIDANVEGERPWFVTKYIDGRHLFYKLDSVGKFTQYEWLKLAHNIFMALSATHFKGIAHRDIKPDNVIYAEKNELYVLVDFGIAIFVDSFYGNLFGSGPSVSLISPKAGTFLYQAPEQTEGFPDLVSDIFAVGTVLYEMLVGTNPWIDALGLQPGTDVRLHKDDVIDAIKNLEPSYTGVSEEQARFLQWLLTKDPVDRPSAELALEATKQWQKTGVLNQGLISTPRYVEDRNSLGPSPKMERISYDEAIVDEMIRSVKFPENEEMITDYRKMGGAKTSAYDEILQFFDELPDEDVSVAISIAGFGTLGIRIFVKNDRYHFDFKVRNLKLDLNARELERLLSGSQTELFIDNRRFDATFDSKTGAKEIGERLVTYLRSRFGEFPPRIRIY